MSDTVLGALVPVIIALLGGLLLFEKRRQQQRKRQAEYLTQLELDERFDELEATIDELDEEEAVINQESRGQAFASFLRGRPTRRITAFGLVDFLHGIVAIGMLAFVIFMVFKSALIDPVVRLILLVTVGVCALIFAIAAHGRRSRREKHLLRSRGHDVG